MGHFKTFAFTAGLVVATSTVHAADLLPPPPPLPAAPYVADVAGGWYLRGDVGVSRYEGDRTRTSTPGAEFYDNDFGSGAFAGAGVGYQFNSYFRADVTGEYRFSTGFNWNDRGAAYTTGSYYNPGLKQYQYFEANGTSYERTRSNFGAAVVLVNGYFDLGTWYGFTPFIGAGVGYAYHFLNGGSTSTINNYGNFTEIGTGIASAGAPPAGVSGGVIRDKQHGDLAYAVYAGIGYDVTPNVKLEVGYRYMNLGEVRTGVVNCYCNQTYAGLRTRELDAHDVRIGMRWAFGAPALPIVGPGPGPLVTRY